jgi:hypothetical protein
MSKNVTIEEIRLAKVNMEAEIGPAIVKAGATFLDATGIFPSSIRVKLENLTSADGKIVNQLVRVEVEVQL